MATPSLHFTWAVQPSWMKLSHWCYLYNRCVRAEIHKLNIYARRTLQDPCRYPTFRWNVWKSGSVSSNSVYWWNSIVTRHRDSSVVFDWCHPLLHSHQWISSIGLPSSVMLSMRSSQWLVAITLPWHTTSTLQRKGYHWFLLEIFYQLLYQAVNNPHFMRSGGCLGFQCQYTYVFTDLNEADYLPFLLKRPDYMVFSAARSMGLKVRVQLVVEGKEHWHSLPCFHEFAPMSQSTQMNHH